MSARTDTRSEIVRLARVLELDAESLGYLEALAAKDIRAYREKVVDALYDTDRELLSRAAESARLLPSRTLARIGEGVLGPLVCAHLTGLLEAERAGEIAQHFGDEFLAQLAAEMDPRRAVAVVSATPSERVVGVAVEMAARGEHVAMGRFVAHLDDETLTAAIERLSDEDLLRVAFVLEGERPHERLFELAGAERMRSMLESAEAAGLQEEATHLREHLSASQRKQLAARAKK